MTARVQKILTSFFVLALVGLPILTPEVNLPTYTDGYPIATAVQAAEPVAVRADEGKFSWPVETEPDPEEYMEPAPASTNSYPYPENVEPGIRALLPVEEQAQLLTDLPTQGTNPGVADYSIADSSYIVSGSIFFAGDVIKTAHGGDPLSDAIGHGLGLSQFGAYGAAYSHGKSAEWILSTYYRDTHIEVRPGMTVNPVKRDQNWNIIHDYGVMDIETYVSGLGEVPSKACGSSAQQAANPSKFKVDDPTIVWDCWPEAAIEAQVIAARSFAVTYSGPICDDERCQVYVGGDAKAWAAQETAGQYIVSHGYTHNGSIIRAYYSSYNSNGWGTSNHATAWANTLSGKLCSPVDCPSWSYLRSVQDNTFTYVAAGREAWTSTSIYSMADMDAMIAWCATEGNCNSWVWIRDNIKNKVGNIVALEFVNDDSGRVIKVIFHGTTGITDISSSGRNFRAIFNKWNLRPGGNAEKIAGITFKANQTFSPTPDQQMVISAAKVELASRLPGANQNMMFAHSWTEAEYGCMGASTSGFCATATTQGYKLLLYYNNQLYEYRVNSALEGLTYVGVTSV